MSYAAAVDHLHGLTQELVAIAPRRKFDLDHMRVLAAALGDPQREFPSILIAGTNGKGSTASTLAAILGAAGVRTGLYTSPHLARVTERIRVSEDSEQGTGNREQQDSDGFDSCSLSEIPEGDFARLYFRVDDTARDLVTRGKLPHHPSFFETLTALAFLYFAERKVEIAILEVGMGGRLDATNIVEPLLSVITDVALDHQEYLGNTIAEIAREKAGILRPGGTLITLPQHPEANQAIGEAAVALNVRGVNAADYLPGRDSLPANNGERTTDNAMPLRPNHYDLFLNGETLHVRSPLAGEHQRRNLALAIATAIELRNQIGYKWKPANCNLQLSSIEAGIAHTNWPGRLEFLPSNLLLDVAHNPAGAWALRAAIASLPDSDVQPRTLIFSCLRDKDLTEMSRILFPLFDAVGPQRTTENGHRTTPSQHIVLTHLDSPRAAGIDSLAAAARALSIPAELAHDPAAALELARSLTPPGGLIIATGSIYLVGAIREAALAHGGSAQ